MKKTFFSLALLTSLASEAQVLGPESVETTFKDGINIEHKPSNFKTKFRFRMQNRFTYQTENTERLSPAIANFSVQRLRLRMDGTLYDPRLLYRIHLAFSRADMNYDQTQYPNILRDAVVGWKFADFTTLWYGQAKLPGNRQLITASGSLEFVDRSLVNATFNLDRDVGAQLYQRIGDSRPVWIRLALTNGKGQSQDNKSDGLSYTSRLEWLPFGTFKDDGDYFEADLSRETTPKLSIGGVYNMNKKSTRSGSQTGISYTTKGLYRDIQTTFIDAIFKYQGFSWTSEYANRWTDDPFFQDGAKDITIYKGEGYNTQIGYVFENNIQPALRYSQIKANDDTLQGANNQKQYTFALSKYINRHVVKVQGDVTYDEQLNPVKDTYHSSWIGRLQVEIGI